MKKVVDFIAFVFFMAFIAWAMLYCGGIVPTFIFGD